MKGNWLVYLVIFSLALNLGTIGTVIYFRYRPAVGPPMETEGRPAQGFLRFLRSLNLDQDQEQLLKQSFPLHRQQIKGLRQQLQEQRLHLYELISCPEPNEAEIASQITRVNNIQNALEQEMARFLLEFKRNLRPEQQAQLLQHVGQRLCGPQCGPEGRPPRGHGRMGPRPVQPPR